MTKVVENTDKTMKDYKNLTSKRSKALGEWVRDHGEYRSADITTATDGGALVPQNLVTSAEDLSARKFQLLPYVNRVSVRTGMGSMPVLDPNEYAETKTELMKDNSIMPDPTSLKAVKFNVKTYLGRLNLSNEFLQDSNSNVLPLLTRQMGTVMVNTQNKAIADKMATIPAKTISTDNELNDLYNAIESVDPRYQSNIFMDQKSYAKVRTLTDKNGRYLMNEHDNTILGIPVVVVPAYTGLQGIYVGDLKTAITYFDRMETSLSYNRPGIFGEALVAALRFDVQVAVPDALIHLTFDDGSNSSKSSNK